MKRGLLLFMGLLMAIIVTAQNVSYQNVNNANTAKLNGVFSFNFDKSFPKEKLDKATLYYLQYFKVKYTKNGSGYNAVITMLDKDPIARRVIERYFMTLGVKSINAGNESFEVRPFIKKYLILPTK